jgi:hypothetical protein
VLFFAFAWFELIDLAPNDPFRLAVAVSVYWLLAFIGMIVFGEETWAERAEPFGIFFGLIGAMSPLARQAGEKPRHVVISLVWPGSMLLDRPPLPLSGVLFVLMVLASVSFDGLSRTFTWLAFNNINPLEFPGRSVVMVSGTVGLLASLGVLTAVFLAAVAAGCRIIGQRSQFITAAGRFVYSIVPISLAFHLAHYLTGLLVDGQYMAIVASDPFGLGMDLFGTASDHITMSLMNTFEGVALIWDAQTGAITLGHIVAIVLAHALALRLFADSRAATLSQLFLAALMVFYTAFGLWLLSTPRI